MVSAQYFAFVVFSVFCVYFISKVAFPPAPPRPGPPVYGQKNKILGLYVLVGAVIGLFLPIACIFDGIIQGDKEGIRAAAPHVFLLASQVLMEGLSFSGGFWLPIRVFVPVFYNSVSLEWLTREISKGGVGFGGSSGRLYVGKALALALANMAFWSLILFGFLLPFLSPKKPLR